MAEFHGSYPRRDSTLLREGVITGLIGAAVVAIFYLLADMLRNHPFMTPSVLGDALVLHRPVNLENPHMAAVAVYTVVHLLAFVAFGTVLTMLARASEVSSLARYAVVQVLVAFVVFFYGVVSLGSEVVRGMLPFVGILAANALAGVAMITWLWRHHPGLRIAVARTPLGATDGRA